VSGVEFVTNTVFVPAPCQHFLTRENTLAI
jgi:hypothetical protein